MKHDQLGEIGEVRSHPLEPLPDTVDDGNNLRPGVGRARGMPERVEIGLPRDCNQVVAARDLTAARSFVRDRPLVSAVHSYIAIEPPIASSMGTAPIPGPSGAVIRPPLTVGPPVTVAFFRPFG